MIGYKIRMLFSDLHIPSVNIPGDLGDLIKLTAITDSTDLTLKKKSIIASKCACFHPCDLEEFDNVVDSIRTAENNRPNSYSNTILMTDNEVSKLSC